MNKTSLLLGWFILAAVTQVMGQRYKTIELKPITQQGWKYFYDLKKVSSPAALEVPLLAVEDEEVNRYLKASKTWKGVGSALTFIPLVYVLSLPRNQYVDPNTFWWVFGATIAAQLGIEAISHVKLGKAIDKYNYLIMQPSGNSLGLQLTWKFM